MTVPDGTTAARYRALTYLERGKHLFNDRRFEDALKSFEQAIAADPALTRAHTARAHCLALFGRREEALAACDEVAAREPNFPFAHISRGTALYHLGRVQEAQAAYEKAIALAPDEPLGYYNVACFFAWVDNEQQCRANLVRALQLDPRNNASAAVDEDFARYREREWFQELVAFRRP